MSTGTGAGFDPGRLPSPTRRDRRAPDSLRVQIGRLAFDGFDLDARQQRAVQQVVAAELSSLLAGGTVPARLRTGGSAGRLPGGELRIGSWEDTADLGRQVARALYGGLHR